MTTEIQIMKRLDFMTLDNVKNAISYFEKVEKRLPTTLRMNSLMTIALREDSKIVDEFKSAGNLSSDLNISFGTLNSIMEANDLPKVTIDNSVGDKIVIMSATAD